MTVLRTVLHGHSGPGVIPVPAMSGWATVKGQYYAQKVLGYSPIAYWPLWETSGAAARCLVDTAQNGSYVGVMLSNTTGPDASPCPFFNGASGFVNVWSETLRDVFNGAEGTAIIWARVFNAGAWADGLGRAALRFYGDAGPNQDYIYHYKGIVANNILHRYVAGGVTEGMSRIVSPTTNWFHLALTWSASGDVTRSFLNGGNELNSATLGVWGGQLLNTQTVIGAGSTTPIEVWHGWLAHPAIYDRALTRGEIIDLATI